MLSVFRKYWEVTEKKMKRVTSTTNSAAVSGNDTRERLSAVFIVAVTNASLVLGPVSNGPGAARPVPPDARRLPCLPSCGREQPTCADLGTVSSCHTVPCS